MNETTTVPTAALCGVLLRRSDRLRPTAELRTPITIYVMWHPSYTAGPELASKIYEWFGEATSDLRRLGLGIPVYFRSADWDVATALSDGDVPQVPAETTDDQLHPAEGPRRAALRRVRRPIDVDAATHNVFMPLVDHNMVADPSWRRDLIELSRFHNATGPDVQEPEPHSTGHLICVQVDSSWTRLPPVVTGIQPIFLHRWSDPSHAQPDAKLRLWGSRVRRELTQNIVRVLRTRAGAHLPTQVFLSHAKRDGENGPGVAEHLRDVAASYGQVEVFYDENDLPGGQAWEGRMIDAAGSSAGFVAIVSDYYATRYWCRREVEMARKPQRLTTAVGADACIWTVRPTVVVVTLEAAWSRLVGDLATPPAVAWDESRGVEVLDRVFREALLAEFQRMYARQLHRMLAARVSREERESLPVALLTWMPDSASLLRLHEQLEQLRPGCEQWLVVYPGHGFLPTEENTLQGFFRRTIRFSSFERLGERLAEIPKVESSTSSRSWAELRQLVSAVDAQGVPAAAPRVDFGDRPRVSLSAGEADDLAVLGYDAPAKSNSRHVDEAVLRIVRGLLEGGARLAYGGTIRDSPNFSSLLHDAVFAAFANTPPRDVHDPDPPTPFENYIPWPNGPKVGVDTRASLVGLARHYDIDPPAEDGPVPDRAPEPLPEPRVPGLSAEGGPVPDRLPEPRPEPRVRWLSARALSRMRRTVAERSVAMVAVSGKTVGFGGFMPGIAEELLHNVEVACDRPHVTTLAAALDEPLSIGPDQVRAVIIGAFGGAARSIAWYLLDRTPQLPAPLTLAWQLVQARNERLKVAIDQAPPRRGWVESRYAALAQVLDGLRQVARMPAPTPLPGLGLTVGEWTSLMRTDSPGYVRRMLKATIIPAL